jgi:hypothetical protein
LSETTRLVRSISSTMTPWWRALVTVNAGAVALKLLAWTAFALAGPLVFLAMRNYLGVALTGGIGVFLGLAVFRSGGVPSPALHTLRIVLVAQGLGLGLYGAYVLSRPALPWVLGAGSTRTSLALDLVTGTVHALELAENGARFFTHAPGTGAWRAESFPGDLVQSLGIGPRGAAVFAPESRSPQLWWLDTRAGRHWRARSGFGFPVTFAATDEALFVAARGALWRLTSPDAEPARVPDVLPTTVCASASQVLAVRSRTVGEGPGRVWRSSDGGARFAAVPDASLPGKLCALSRDGWAWVAEAGLFQGDLFVAAPRAAFEDRGLPAPRVEALVVNPDDGTEAWIGVWGAGVFRSLDAGATWKPMGLEGFEVSALVVDFRRKVAYAGTGSGAYTLAY